MSGMIEAIISLPDYAFRRSGAQNKTSILIFRKYTKDEARRFNKAYRDEMNRSEMEDEAILQGLSQVEYRCFLAEAMTIGYTATGTPTEKNELYVADSNGFVAADQTGSILGELRRFQSDPEGYDGHRQPDAMALSIVDMWKAHPSHRLDPKYFLFKQLEEQTDTPAGWVRKRIREVMRRREEPTRPEERPDDPVIVLTVAQTGELRTREAGKGNNPP
jgi:type I restriction enzyme M protein